MNLELNGIFLETRLKPRVGLKINRIEAVFCIFNCGGRNKSGFLVQILGFGRSRNNFKKSNSSGTLLRFTCEYVSVRLNSYFTCLTREMLFGF